MTQFEEKMKRFKFSLLNTSCLVGAASARLAFLMQKGIKVTSIIYKVTNPEPLSAETESSNVVTA